MLPGIDRPAIAAPCPTKVGESVLLDLGANVEGDAENLVQFGMLGAAFARTVFGIEQLLDTKNRPRKCCTQHTKLNKVFGIPFNISTQI